MSPFYKHLLCSPTPRQVLRKPFSRDRSWSHPFLTFPLSYGPFLRSVFEVKGVTFKTAAIRLGAQFSYNGNLFGTIRRMPHNILVGLSIRNLVDNPGIMRISQGLKL